MGRRPSRSGQCAHLIHRSVCLPNSRTCLDDAFRKCVGCLSCACATTEGLKDLTSRSYDSSKLPKMPAGNPQAFWCVKLPAGDDVLLLIQLAQQNPKSMGLARA